MITVQSALILILLLILYKSKSILVRYNHLFYFFCLLFELFYNFVFLQQHGNNEEIPALQHKIQEVTAAKEAHIILAQTTLDDMNYQIARSKRLFALLKWYRRVKIFDPNIERRKVFKVMYMCLLVKLQFILIADYQMV